MGVFPAIEPPEMYPHLNAVYKGVNQARATGWGAWGMKVPLFEIEAAYRINDFHGNLDEYVDLFRACEREIDDRRDTKDSRNSDRSDTSQKGRG